MTFKRYVYGIIKKRHTLSEEELVEEIVFPYWDGEKDALEILVDLSLVEGISIKQILKEFEEMKIIRRDGRLIKFIQ